MTLHGRLACNVLVCMLAALVLSVVAGVATAQDEGNQEQWAQEQWDKDPTIWLPSRMHWKITFGSFAGFTQSTRGVPILLRATEGATLGPIPATPQPWASTPGESGWRRTQCTCWGRRDETASGLQPQTKGRRSGSSTRRRRRPFTSSRQVDLTRERFGTHGRLGYS